MEAPAKLRCIVLKNHNLTAKIRFRTIHNNNNFIKNNNN